VTLPKSTAAIDELFSRLVRKHGEDAVEAAIAFLLTATEPPPEKPVAIPVTKELVLSEQTEVRNAD